MTTKQINNHRFRIAVQPPPGSIVAPDGFPADPRPKGAPKVFLDAMDVRIKVFCDEQQCAIEPELDEDDPKSWSWVVYRSSSSMKKSDGETTEEQDQPVSTIRIVPPPHAPHPNGYSDSDEEPYIKLTRVATLADARGNRLTGWLCEEAFRFCAEHPELMGQGWKGMVLTHAQVVVEKVYEKMGFATDEKLGRWDEEGIVHLGMWKRLDLKKV